MLGMKFKPLHTTFLGLSTRADLKSPISTTSERPTQLDTGTDIMSDTCTETKPSPSTLTDPSAEENRELKNSTYTRCDTVVKNAIMSETSTATGLKSPSVDLFSPPTQENLEAGTSAKWDMPAEYDSDSDSDIQTVILCDSPSESDSPQISSPTSSDDSSDGSSSRSSNSSSGAKSESSSIGSVDTSSKSPHIALFIPSSQENCEFQTSTTSETTTQYDSDSDVQTVILCDDTSENEANTLQNSSSSQKESNTISSTLSDDSPDDSSDGSSSWTSDSSCGTKSESSSIDSFDTLSRHDSDSEEEETPKGSQMLAAYASPLQDGQRVRTSCDSIHDPGRWQVDPDGFINERYRAGGPFLCSLPETILNLKASSPLMAVVENISLLKMIFSVLEEYQVNASSVKIKRCQYEFWPILQPLATLIITATRDTFSDDWVQACREIWRRLSEHELGHINVEISDPTLHNPFHFWPVDSKHPYFSKHKDVMEKVRTEVGAVDWVELAAYRIGTTSDVKDSEVFMHLIVDFKSERDWRGTREQMLSILEDSKLPMVGVMIQKGKRLGLRLGL
ncbi:hypothetical protein PENPOL_c019G05828 [Penicillium polonicum]|uniref:Uncharacterized protein n=1 Tax=Penicillium polonicum TaxID=60169 RepID=A0A1V6N8Q5_PENPO|nr:hypothetical protein PENPOL_c019G05828 [Penicillium polonicum]